MFKNYFKTAWRNLVRRKAFGFINIFGLAVSMSVCMLIILIISDQNSYDTGKCWGFNGDMFFYCRAAGVERFKNKPGKEFENGIELIGQYDDEIRICKIC